MTNKSWAFVGGELKSIADIDAALSSAPVDLDGNSASYSVRVDHRLFLDLNRIFQDFVQAVIADTADESENHLVRGLRDIAVRLKNGHLAILPKIPQLHEMAEAPALADELLGSPLLLGPDANGIPALRLLDADELSDVRSRELSDIVEAHRQRALLSVEEGHFELPSGAHTSHFVRLAECLANTEDLDRIVYWIARDILAQRTDGGAHQQFLVLVDNPSTLIIALRLAQVFPRIAVRYDCVRAYPENPNSVADLRQWLQPRLNDCTHIHCVVSVSSTGGLTRALSDAAAALGVSAGVSVLYATTKDVAEEAYCVLEIPDYWHSTSLEHCEPCKQKNSAVFRIDKARYFLTERNVESVALPPPFFRIQRNFIETYGGIDGVLRTHVNDLSWRNGKHRAFSVDVERLLQSEAFRREIVAKVKEILPAPDLVVVPPHSGARAIANFLSKELGLKVETHPTLRLDPCVAADHALAQAISGARSLLIVDDVAYSPERIQSYVKAIRESGNTYQAPPLITLFPLLALPAIDSQLDTAIRGIEADHAGRILRIVYLYRFPLPDLDESHCPWCHEARLITQLPSAFDEDSSDGTDERGTLLSQLERGLVRDDWLSVHGGLSAPLFGKDSPLLTADATPIQVLFACASAVQQVRTAKKNRLNPEGFPKSTVLGAAVIRDFQNEMLLVACLLRCLVSTEMDEEAKIYLRDRIAAISDAVNPAPDLWALQELLLAQMRGLVRWINDETIRRAIYKSANFSAFLGD